MYYSKEELKKLKDVIKNKKRMEVEFHVRTDTSYFGTDVNGHHGFVDSRSPMPVKIYTKHQQIHTHLRRK